MARDQSRNIAGTRYQKDQQRRDQEKKRVTEEGDQLNANWLRVEWAHLYERRFYFYDSYYKIILGIPFHGLPDFFIFGINPAKRE